MLESQGMLRRLGFETLAHHGDADADLDRYLFRARTTRDDYRTYLARIYGYVLPLELALTATPGLSDLVDLGARAKTTALLHDLCALGMTLGELAELPQCLTIPAFRGPAAALGWLYVAERPMLASAVVRRHLETRLPAEIGVASSYLSVYDGVLGVRWRELGVALERVACAPAIADRVVAAAHDAFRCLHRWRSHEPSRAQRVRIAG